MTMTEGVLRDDALSADDGRLTLAVHLPWYRSLPLSCHEAVEVTVADGDAPVRAVAVPGFAGSLAEAGCSDAWWDLRDPLEVSLDASAAPGDVVPLEVGIAVRIPYLQQAPGVPLVQRVVVRTESTVR